ncbi:hypothetical protein BJY04DRAFT_174641 [Aspergillus karnatakaensis]|uniref:Zn(II)2Cys6 transcription factor domain-containing protein n=1 Tax=Aspergillus karnatakaensis TaxID=1810916 RepID=UPI003CCCE60D
MADQLPRHNFRLIAPRTGTEPPTASRSPDENKTKRATTACGECKHRRTKCFTEEPGGPCTECKFHNRECIIDEMADKRRKVAARETEENLKKTQRELERCRLERDHLQHALTDWATFAHFLVSAIRYCPISEVHNLIGLARADSSNREIYMFCTQFAHLYPQSNLRHPFEPQFMDGMDGVDGVHMDGVDGVDDEDGTPGRYGPRH